MLTILIEKRGKGFMAEIQYKQWQNKGWEFIASAMTDTLRHNFLIP